ncbi:hypothetical protein GCM10009573_33670 [Agromyces bracchium]
MTRLEDPHDITGVDDTLAAELDHDARVEGLGTRRARVVPHGLLAGADRVWDRTHERTLGRDAGKAPTPCEHGCRGGAPRARHPLVR